MSSRILQENSSLLLTENNEPLINDNFISTDNVLTLPPVLSPTTIEQNHALLGTPIVTQSPILTEPFYDAALSRTVSITADSSNSVVIEEVDGNVVTLTEMSNVINLDKSVNTSTTYDSINRQSISRSINEVA